MKGRWSTCPTLRVGNGALMVRQLSPPMYIYMYMYHRCIQSCVLQGMHSPCLTTVSHVYVYYLFTLQPRSQALPLAHAYDLLG